jgi:hypothetical protein
MKKLLQISKGIKKMVIVLVMALIIVSTGNARTVYAEGLHELSEDNSVMLESVEKCDDYITKDYSDSTGTYYKILSTNVPYSNRSSLGSEYNMEVGKVYRVVYPDALIIPGNSTPLTVRVDVELLQDYAPGFSKILIYTGTEENNFYKNKVSVYWNNAQDVKVRWTISLFEDSDCTIPNSYPVLTGLEDPDESDYLFNTSGREIYYKDAKSGKIINPTNGYSFNETTSDDETAFKKNGAKLGDTPQPYDNALFLVSETNEFKFTTRTYFNGTIAVPYFYAPCYNVVYKANETSVDKAEGDATGTVDPQKNIYNIGNTISTEEYELAGYEFVGWNTAADGSGISFQGSDPYNVPSVNQADNTFKQAVPAGGEVVLYAQWKPMYNVVYKANETSVGKAEGDATGTVEPQKNVYNTENKVSSEEYELAGYKFVGWNTAADGSGIDFKAEDPYNVPNDKDAENTFKTIVPAGSDVVLYAQWEPFYNVVYKANETSVGKAEGDATGTVDPQNNLYNEEKNVAENAFKLPGYRFTGWNTEADGSGVAFADKDPYNVPNDKDAENTFKKVVPAGSDVVLYAQWEKIVYRINYITEKGGTGSMKSDDYDFEDTTMMSRNNEFIAEPGYRFKGFRYEGKDGTKAVYMSASEFVDILKDEVTGPEITLIAMWEKIPAPAAVEKPAYVPPVTGIE